MCDLTDNQLQRLAQYLIDDFGLDLTDQKLTDCVLLLFEDIAGFETADARLTQSTVNQIRKRYYDLNNKINADPQA